MSDKPSSKDSSFQGEPSRPSVVPKIKVCSPPDSATELHPKNRKQAKRAVDHDKLTVPKKIPVDKRNLSYCNIVSTSEYTTLFCTYRNQHVFTMFPANHPKFGKKAKSDDDFETRERMEVSRRFVSEGNLVERVTDALSLNMESSSVSSSSSSSSSSEEEAIDPSDARLHAELKQCISRSQEESRAGEGSSRDAVAPMERRRTGWIGDQFFIESDNEPVQDSTASSPPEEQSMLRRSSLGKMFEDFKNWMFCTKTKTD